MRQNLSLSLFKLLLNVFTGPALSPFKDDVSVGWIITKYDAFGRPIYTGWTNQAVSSAARYTLQYTQNSATVLFETKTATTIDGIATNYNNSNSPTSFKLLTVNYYDDYTFPGAQSAPTTIIGQTVLTNAKGLPTGSWTRALTTPTSTAGETSTIFYDKIKARPISTYLKNHLGGVSHTDNELDFVGKTLTTQTEHQRLSGGAKINIEEKFTYTLQDRLLTHTHKIGSAGTVQLMASNTYDNLGQLISKAVGNSTGAPLQKVDFNYNIRGWLTEINKTSSLQQGSDAKDLFAFKINYNTNQTGISDVPALYNGNIAETFWRTSSDNTERAYGYNYDKLNRLKNAIYEKNGSTTRAYDENLTYDKNGNIMSLLRNGNIDPEIGPIEIDKLIYTYPDNSNQLATVVDNSSNTSGFNDFNKTGNDFTYDIYGNMITDKNKKITAITYNHLNLPKKITFGTTGNIEYIYNAAGQKLEKIVTIGVEVTKTNYLNGFQYKGNVLEFFPTAEGYVKNTSGTYSYVFQYKDHLGNVRLSYAKNPTTHVLEIIEENNYYPFGLKHKGYNDYVGNNNKYKYNGKELQDELGLLMYDMDMRKYDPALARWVVQDPITHFENSPYNAFDNNPVFFTDPSGSDSEPNDIKSLIYGGHWSDRIRGVASEDENKTDETWNQHFFRNTLTAFVTNLDSQNKGDLSENKTDKDVDAYELFYQWVMGTGSDERNFDQNSTMGKQMLQAPEVLEAINRAASSGKDEKFNRSLKDENTLLYVKSFYEDVDGKNPARGFHGSFAGSIKVDSAYKRGNVMYTNMSIIISDKMTATSGTRASGTVGGYDAVNPLAIYPKQNPYGPKGQFRTIYVKYKMTISVTKVIN